ncbi:MAG: sensor histidine kinase [Propionibacteriaceae bacterium]|jgi:two-component sensor histidine kinase|nr:sensor histidine kinase [Propionibacteriaceae bacterium]
MPDTLETLVRAHSNLEDEDIEWLKHLTEEWSVLADLVFSDLVLWVPDVDDSIFWAVAHIRPNTAPTSMKDEMVGENISYDYESLVTTAYLSQDIAHSSVNSEFADIPVEEHAIPILRNGRCIGIVDAHANLLSFRAKGSLEENYLKVGRVLAGMVMRREFPPATEANLSSFSPRVIDGVVMVDANGLVDFASPNARTAFRRLGSTSELDNGDPFEPVVRAIIKSTHKTTPWPVKETLLGNGDREVELEVGRVGMRMRFYKLSTNGAPYGVLLLCRDTTDLLVQEKKLVTKNATIREIHHRVKNSLAMVAALLRLQSRRVKSEEAKQVLEDAMRRVSAIAAVHNVLSTKYDEQVDYDEVADRLFKMIGTSGKVNVVRQGSFGRLDPEIAERLSLILTEVCQNAIEHGLEFQPGDVFVTPQRVNGVLITEVVNHGKPLPEGFDLRTATSLGLSIAKTMVKDVDGDFTLENMEDGGTEATIRIPLNS